MSDAAGFLTTHVLDTSRGVPATDLAIELFRLTDGSMQKVASATTNQDGRTDKPILSAEHFATGTYELVFHAGAYLRRIESNLAEPLFLDTVPIRFGMSDATAHYHVPLLLSPYGYSTYRGS